MKNFTTLPSGSGERGPLARLCVLVALVAGSLIFAAAIGWAKNDPLPTFWDEANYFGDAASDYWAVRGHLPLRERILTLVKTDVGQPPAHRGVLALTLVLGPRPGVLRFASIGALLLTVIIVFRTGKRVAGTAAGALAGLVVLASPIVLASSLRFGTEYTLYLAEAATLYFLLASLSLRQANRRLITGLGIALGAGLWCKPSFVLIVLPALALTFALSYRKICGPPYRWLVKACLLGGAIGAVYLVPFGLKTLDYLNRSVNKMGGRHSLGEPSLPTLAKYLPAALATVTGPAGAAVVAVAVVALAARLFAKRSLAPATTAQAAAAGVCFAASAFLPLSHFFSADHDMRYLSSGMIPLSLFVGITLSRLAFGGVPAVALGAALALFAQIVAMVLPIVRDSPRERFEAFGRETIVSNTGNDAHVVFAPQEQWDWEKLRNACGIRTLHDPLIGYVGAGEQFNEKQIFYTWIRHDEAVRPVRMWKYTLGPIDWAGTMRAADASDVILTAPGYRGLEADRQPLDNVNNAAFAERLKRDPHFEPPLSLTLGRYDPTNVLVFINTRTGLHCNP